MSAITAYVELKGVDKLSGPLRKAQARFSHFSKKLERRNKGLERSFKRVERVNSGLIKGLSRLGLVAGGVASIGLYKVVQAGAEFETSMADLSAITGVAGKDLEFLKEQSIKLSKESVVPASQVAEAFKLVASAKSELLEDLDGFNEVTKQVLLLSNASGLDLASAATVATQSMNQFGLSADDAGRAVNVFAAGSKIGASEVNETGAAIVKAGVAARGAKISFEETNSAIQVLAKGGIKGSEAGTMLRNIFNRLEKQNNKNFKPSVVGINEALENLSEANLNTAKTMELFGEEAASGASILIRDRAVVADWTKRITGTSVASEQAAKKMDTFSKKADKLQESLKSRGLTIFDSIKPSLEKGLKVAQDVLDDLDEKDSRKRSNQLAYNQLKKIFLDQKQLEAIDQASNIRFLGFGGREKRKGIIDSAFDPEMSQIINSSFKSIPAGAIDVSNKKEFRNFRAKQVLDSIPTQRIGVDTAFDADFEGLIGNIVKHNEAERTIEKLNAAVTNLYEAVTRQKEAAEKASKPQDIEVRVVIEKPQIDQGLHARVKAITKSNLGQVTPTI